MEVRQGVARYILNRPHSHINNYVVCKITNSLIKLFLLLVRSL